MTRPGLVKYAERKINVTNLILRSTLKEFILKVLLTLAIFAEPSPGPRMVFKFIFSETIGARAQYSPK